jgi:magnesium-transporting ATPase (P-type)
MSLLTGESVSVNKLAVATGQEVQGSSELSMILSGTLVTSGHAHGRVTVTASVQSSARTSATSSGLPRSRSPVSVRRAETCAASLPQVSPRPSPWRFGARRRGALT